MAADWNKLADAYGSDSNIVIASVDVTQNQDIGEALDIKGFPTLKLFSKGNTFEYKGKRSYQQLKSFVDGGYIRQGKVKTEEEMNIFDHAYKRYQEFMLRVLRVVQTDFLLPMGKEVNFNIFVFYSNLDTNDFLSLCFFPPLFLISILDQ